MSVKYIYLDDEDYNTIGPFVEEVKRANTELDIEHRHPGDYNGQITALTSEKFDGLILDLRLDQDPGANKIRSEFRATTLAQELRTRATEQANGTNSVIKDFPIVLWSMDARLRQSFNRDATGHDLFDLKNVKEDIRESVEAQKIASRLVSLVNGYARIRTALTAINTNNVLKIHKLLGFETAPSFIDPRILSHFDNETDGVTPPHEYARFIINDLFKFPGSLIDKQLLLARLGIDEQKSDAKAIEKLLFKYLKDTRYAGVFNDGWQRWWNYLLEEWWRQLEGNPGPLRSTPADQRITFLQKKTKITGLVSAKPIKSQYGTNFWVVCQVTNKPLSPDDGFVIKTKGNKPWQDRLYINKSAALKGSYKQKGLTIDSLEEERLKNLRQQIRRESKRD